MRGLERDEEAIDRDDVDVSLAALEPTIGYDAGAGVTTEVIASSIRPVASSIRSAYAWIRGAARIHSTRARNGALVFILAVR